MSNFLAIATVTEVLSQLIHSAAENALGKQVTINKSRPEDPVGLDTVSVHLYLYQVTPNAALRNNDLPSRVSDGRVQQKPQAALDLHYLIVFYGDDAELEPQRMLGAVVRELHARSVLTREQIRKGVNDINYLAGTDLADAIELVKLTPTPFSLEESSKLWSTLLQTKHALSIAYQGSVVLIESLETPQQALPVSDRGVTSIPFIQPVIEQLRGLDANGSELPVNQTIELGSRLLIKGKNLKGQITQVLLNDAEVAAESVTDTAIRLAPLPAQLPDTTPLRAGVTRMQVLHSLPLGTPPVTHSVTGSEVMPFLLRPNISASLQGAAIRIQFVPRVGRKQRVILILNELTANPKPKGYRLDAPKDNGITNVNTDDTDGIDFPVTKIAPGTYLVRVQVDGAESLLQKNAGGLYDQPQVIVP
jgi:hypothetical protein